MSGGMPPAMLAGDLGGGLPAQFRVWPDPVVVVSPGGEDEAGVSQRGEQRLIEASSRRRPLKLSTRPFCIGLPGPM